MAKRSVIITMQVIDEVGSVASEATVTNANLTKAEAFEFYDFMAEEVVGVLKKFKLVLAQSAPPKK